MGAALAAALGLPSDLPGEPMTSPIVMRPWPLPRPMVRSGSPDSYLLQDWPSEACTFASLSAHIDGEVGRLRRRLTFPMTCRFDYRRRRSVRQERRHPHGQRLLSISMYLSGCSHVGNPRASLTLIVTRDDGIFWEAAETVLASPELERLELRLGRVLRVAGSDWNAPLDTGTATASTAAPGPLITRPVYSYGFRADCT